MSWGIWLGAVLGLLVLLLCVPVFVVVRYRTDSPAQAYLRWMFFKLALLPPHREKPEKPQKKQKAAEKTTKKPPKKLLPTAFSDQLALAVDLLSAVQPPLAMLLRRFRIYRLSLHILVSEQDAAETALAYGRVCTVVYGAYAAAAQLLNIAPPEIEIRPSFTAGEGEVLFDLRGRLTPLAALASVLMLGGLMLKKTVQRGKEPQRPDRAEAAERAEAADRSDAMGRAEAMERAEAADRADLPL